MGIIPHSILGMAKVVLGFEMDQ